MLKLLLPKSIAFIFAVQWRILAPYLRNVTLKTDRRQLAPSPLCHCDWSNVLSSSITPLMNTPNLMARWAESLTLYLCINIALCVFKCTYSSRALFFKGPHWDNSYKEDWCLPLHANRSGQSSSDDGGDHCQRPCTWPHWTNLLAVHKRRKGTQTEVSLWCLRVSHLPCLVQFEWTLVQLLC